MPQRITKTSEFIRTAGELSLDGEDCVNLIRSTLAKKADLRFRVRGFSMSPFIKDGDIVTLSSLPEGRIGFGYVVAFTRHCDNKLIIHRVVRVRRRPHAQYITKGDNLNEPDCAIYPGDVLAYVKKVERNGRRVSAGTGPKGKFIAFLSRVNALSAIFYFWRLIPYPVRRKIKESASMRKCSEWIIA